MRIVRVHGAWFTDKGHTIAAGGGTRLKTIWRVFFAGCPWCAPAAAESSGCTPFAFRDRSESVSQASTIVGIGRSWKTTSTSLRISRICRFFFFFLFFPSIVMNFRDGIATETSRSWIKIFFLNSSSERRSHIRWGFDRFTAIENSVESERRREGNRRFASARYEIKIKKCCRGTCWLSRLWCQV